LTPITIEYRLFDDHERRCTFYAILFHQPFYFARYFAGVMSPITTTDLLIAARLAVSIAYFTLFAAPAAIYLPPSNNARPCARLSGVFRVALHLSPADGFTRRIGR